MTILRLFLLGLCPLCWCISIAGYASDIDASIIERPDSVILDRAVQVRWQALFQANPAWAARQISFLELRTKDIAPSLLISRLLYRGEAWTRRANDHVSATQWQQDNLEIKQTILRCLRARGDVNVIPYVCHYLTIENNPTSIISALSTLAVLEAKAGAQLETKIAFQWAYRLADPRAAQALPGAQSSRVRQVALEYLLQTQGLAASETQAACEWALLHVTGIERNRAITLLSALPAKTLRQAVIMTLIKESRDGVLDELGKQGLAQAISDLHGEADDALVLGLMDLVVRGERVIATTAATALGTTLTWETPVAINDLITRITQDADPVVRQALLGLLLRLDPISVANLAATTSGWAALANHHFLLQQWSAPAPLLAPEITPVPAAP
jgi:hypothetical protein